jgi:hypothetical protein
MMVLRSQGFIARGLSPESPRRSSMSACHAGSTGVARQSGWEGSDNQDGHFGGRGDVMIVAARR